MWGPGFWDEICSVRFGVRGTMICGRGGGERISPVLMGEGENLFSGINLCELGFSVSRSVPGENATHVIVERM
jgi:hypothetical protein